MKCEEPIHLIVDSIQPIATTWIDTLSALLVPTIASIGIYIAFQQYHINKQRLRHETYERRLNIYKCAQRYLSEIMRDGKTSYTSALKFYQDASEAAFIFDDSVQQKIDAIYSNSMSMITIYEDLYPSDGSPG